jgi:hypothetical protein
VEAFWAAREAAPAAQGAELIVCSADSKGVVMRPEASAAEVPGVGSSKAATDEDQPGGKKMALIGAVYTVAPHCRSPEQVLQALFELPPSSGATLLPRPKPLHKYVRASLARDAHATMGPAYQGIFAWLAQEQRQRNPSGQQPVVVLMDGQASLWKAAQQALAGVPYVEVLDRMHALGYLWEAAELLYPRVMKKAQAGFLS